MKPTLNSGIQRQELPKIEKEDASSNAATSGGPSQAKEEKPLGLGAAKDQFEKIPANTGIGGGTVVPELKGPRSSDPAPSQPSQPGGQTPAERALHNKDLGSTSGAEVKPGDFSRETKLRGLIDPRAGLPAGKAGPGQSNPLDGAGKLPTLGDFKNQFTRTGAASDEPAPSEAPKPLGPDTEVAAKWKEAVAKAKDNPAPPAKDTSTPAKDAPPPPADSGYSPYTLSRAWAEFTHLITPEGKMPGMATHEPIVAVGNRGTPDPEKDTGDGHGPKPLVDGQFPTIGEAVNNQHRQVSQPGDGGSKPDRMHANLEVALEEGLRMRADGRIDPGSSDGTTEGQHVDQPPPGSGIEQVDGTKKGDPKHPGSGEE